MAEPIEVRPGVAIDPAEIELRASRSSGPGGQHANVTASRVEARFVVADSASLIEAQKRRLTARLGPVVTAVSQESRSQHRNRELAIERLIRAARRCAASPAGDDGRRSRAEPRSERRLEAKRRPSERKRARRKPRLDEG